MSINPGPSGHQSRCPRCGLEIEVVARGGGPELGYDFAAWNRLCKEPMLGGPSMCLARACFPVVSAMKAGAVRRGEQLVEPFG